MEVLGSTAGQVARLPLNLDETREWLEIVYSETPGYLHISATGAWQGRTIPANDVETALLHIQRLDEDLAPEGIYLRACTLRTPPQAGGRGTDQDSHHLPGLWADIDIAGPGHKTTQPLPPNTDEAMRIVTESGLPLPSHWIHSGGGLYPWWLLRQSTEISDLEAFRALSSGWQHILAASAKKLGYHYGAGVGDLSRILRIPGTINRKAGLQRPCTALPDAAWSGPLYDLEDLVDAMVAATPEPPTPTRIEQRLQTAQGNRPGDHYNAITQWIDLLGPLGWTWVYKRGDKWHLRRPGKHEGTSATLSTTTDRLYLFTDAAAPFEPLKHYSKFEAFTLLEHHGDFASAARELGRRGYGTKRGTVDVSTPNPYVAGTIPSSSVASPVQPASHTTMASTTTRDVKSWQHTTFHDDVFRRREHNHLGVAETFADVYDRKLRYVPDNKNWSVWNERRWEQDGRDSDLPAVAYLLKAGSQLRHRDDDEHLAATGKWMNKLLKGSAATLRSWIRADPRIIATAADFDRNRHLITCHNGVIDLDGLHFQNYHDPDQMLTREIPVTYDKDAECPRWTKFLQQAIPQQSMREYLQKAIGLTLLGDTSERAVFLLHGESGTGKSQFIKVMELMFGDFACTAQPATFTKESKKATITNNLNDLRGRRFVSISELDEDEELNESLVKRMTGGDTATTRRLYGENQQWRVEFMLWMATNYLPRLKSDDNAIWRRVKPVPFAQVINETDEIKNLGELLYTEEASGILNWMLEGVRLYQQDGLHNPPEIVEAVAAYRKDVDTVAQFLEAKQETGHLTVDPTTTDNSVPARTLHLWYQEWCRDNGIRWLSERRFKQRLQSLGFEQKRTNSGMWWTGIRQNTTLAGGWIIGGGG